MNRYVPVRPPGIVALWRRSSPMSAAFSCTDWAKASCPSTVTMAVCSPSRQRLWAMLRPTPPSDVVTRPGLESRATSRSALTAPMSIFTPPTTTMYFSSRSR